MIAMFGLPVQASDISLEFFLLAFCACLFGEAFVFLFDDPCRIESLRGSNPANFLNCTLSISQYDLICEGRRI